jgi:hypothetical protein
MSAFQRRTNPAVDPFGNAPRLDGAARSFRTFRTNMSVAKSFTIREKTHADFRADIFDLFNQKTWSNPTTDLSSNQFGIITNASGNRTMQLGLKLVF